MRWCTEGYQLINFWRAVCNVRRVVDETFAFPRRGERHVIRPEGLHLIKGEFQKEFLAEQCRELTNCLTEAMAATMKAAPVRIGKRYIQQRHEPRTMPAREATWEEALFRSRWAAPPIGTAAPWKRLLTYQVLLQNARSDEHWGEIDLLGVSRHDAPVIVELTASGSQESPAQMLVQATAYGVALRKAWPSCLRAEWAEALGIPVESLPEELHRCELVCAAPSEYWEHWVGAASPARSITPEAWTAIAELRKSLAKSGYPSSFVRLNHDGAGPANISVVEQRLPTG